MVYELSVPCALRQAVVIHAVDDEGVPMNHHCYIGQFNS